MADRSDKERRIIGATIGGAAGGAVSSLIGHWVEHVLRGWAARRDPAGIAAKTISQAQQP